MGIYDRDYYRQSPRPGFSLRTPRSVVTTLVLINVGVYVADGLLWPDTHRLTETLAVRISTLTHPWLWWQFLTYGFAHAPSPSHILFNMLTFWFLGRDIEFTYGPKEFLRLYLMMLIVGSLAWTIGNRLRGVPADAPMICYGASGAIAGIVVLYALHFPRRTLLLFFVVPVPAWLVGVMVVLFDIFGATGHGGPSNIAYSVHLAGAAFAFLYYQFGWNIGRLVPDRFSLSRLKPRPRLRVHDPDTKQRNISEEVDQILEKIHREGEDSLTRKERRTLQNASREYQRRQQTGEWE